MIRTDLFSVQEVEGHCAMSFDDAKRIGMAEMAKLTPREGKAAIAKMSQDLLDIQAKRDQTKANLEMLDRAQKSVKEWYGMQIRLERNDCSRFHKLQEDGRASRVFGNQGGCMSSKEATDIYTGRVETFVVDHDWAGAFEGAEGIEGGYRLPYEICSFEFRISGKSVIMLCADPDTKALGRDGVEAAGFVQCADCWIAFDASTPRAGDPECALIRLLWSQIRAICIALDADVATQEVVRAPHKLNQKRAKLGKAPLPDYRIVNLAKRHRVPNPVTNQGSGTKKRLHFRRGHWRHFETSKTWVKWCLVGNPDLGFINKHYRL